MRIPIYFIALLMTCSSALAVAKTTATANVLLLISYDPTYPTSQSIVSQVQQDFVRHNANIKLQVEYIDADLGMTADYEQAFAQFLIQKKPNGRRYHLVLAADNSALIFAAKHQATLFDHAPLLFLNVSDAELVRKLQNTTPISGVMSVPPIYEFLALQQYLYPQSSTLHVITDELTHQGYEFARITRAAKSLNITIEELPLTQLTWEQLARKLRHLSQQPILSLSAFHDFIGAEKSIIESALFMNEHSASPVWRLREAGIGQGYAGGVTTNLKQSIHLVTTMSLRILEGADIQEQPIHWQPPVTPKVDLSVVKHYGFTAQDFPKNTEFIDSPETFWERNGFLLALVTLIVVSTLTALVWTRRQKEQRRLREYELTHRTQLLSNLLNSLPEVFFFKDLQGRYQIFNRKFASFAKTHPLNKTDEELFDHITAAEFAQHDEYVRTSLLSCASEDWVPNAQGKPLLFRTLRSPIFDEDDELQGIFGLCVDITRERLAEDQLAHIAHHDELTDLPNRTSLRKHLVQRLNKAQTKNQVIAVAYLDLDRFKDINDTLGHEVGDILLKEVGHRLHNNIRQEDICARIGSDEFVIVLDNIENYQNAVEKCQNLLSVLARPYRLEGHLISLFASAGISMYPQDSNNPDNLVRYADAALYKAKELGRNRCHKYSSELTSNLHDRMELEQDLHIAMEKRQFLLVYQPQFRIGEDRPCRAEALVRWQHPTRGFVSPVEFIPLAENNGMMLDLGFWILRTACQQFLFWREQGLHLEKIAVNISPAQITNDFAQHVSKILLALEFNPLWLELEVTEGLMMSEASSVIDQIHELRQLGIEFAIDDFGTGYSSLSKLKSMPVTVLKVDQSFVRNINTDDNDFKIAQAIIQMAKSLNLTTVAEGVETEQHEAILKDLGCDLMQGYYYAKPLAADELFERYYTKTL